jgi:hypothetical protein
MPPLPHNLEYVPEIYSEYELPTPKAVSHGKLCKDLPILASDEISAPSGIDVYQPSSPLPPVVSASLSLSSSTSSDNLFLKDTKMLLNERIINNQDTNETNIPSDNEKSSFQTVLDTLIEAFTRNCLILNSDEDRYYPDPSSLEIDVTYSGFDDAETLSSISTPSKMGGHEEEEYYLPWVDM